MTFTDMAELYRSLGKTKKCTFVFCADHGVAELGVSAYPQSTTASMVKAYLVHKGAAANAFAAFAGSELVVVDVGVNADISNLPNLVDRKIAFGTGNITEGPAMSRAQARRAVKIGKDLTEKAIRAGYNCFLIGEMGIANTTVASALAATFLGTSVVNVTGRGSNISDERFNRKIAAVRRALRRNSPNPKDPFDVLAKIGGFEFGAMAGVILAAAKHDCVVILDGFNTACAALIADAIDPAACNCVIASHIGREPGHLPVIEYLGLTPMFKLDLALSEAVGSSIAARVLDRIVYVYVCEDGDDFDGDLSEFKEDVDEGAIVNDILDKIGLGEMSHIHSLEDLENYLDKNFEGDLRIEEVDLDFQISEDLRLVPFVPPFSVSDFNIPRSYPMLVREMGGESEESVAATGKTFDFYLSAMPHLDLAAMQNCRSYLNSLIKPRAALGLLEDIAAQFAGITRSEKPPCSLRRAALAFTNSENSPNRKRRRRNVSMDFSMSARTFAMRIFLGVVDNHSNPTVAFNFGRNLAEEISFSTPVIALTDLSDWNIEKTDERFARALLDSNGAFKVAPENFLSYVPEDFKCLAGAIIGAIVAAARNSTLIVTDCGAVDIIARYLESLCPQVRPFILHATDLINSDFEPGQRIGFDGEIACIGAEIVEAALVALNGMKTFDAASVDGAID